MNELDTRDLTANEARESVERTKRGLEAAANEIVRQINGRAWLALNYASWDEMREIEYSGAAVIVPRADRPQLSARLAAEGLSQKQISETLGVSQATVSGDLRDVINSDNALSDNGQPETRTDSLGREQPRAKPRPAPPVQPAGTWYAGPDEPEPVPLPVGQAHADAAVAKIENRPARPAPVMLTLRTNTGKEVPYPKPQAKPTFNQSDGEGISWAAWSWNPVTGCLHGCGYCYARAIAARFTDAYPAGFTPLFHHERLDAPANTTIPAAHRDDPAFRRVFVCSMADLYGRWVPDEWIEQVHTSMLTTPEWEYLLLTKFPARYVGLDLPKSGWIGTSVDEQKRVRIAEDAFRQIDGVKVKWLSLEPLKEPLEFTDLSMFDWVVIGAQTETRQPSGTVPAFMPPWEWICRITAQAKEAGCRVHWKPNLYNGRPGLPLNEYPEA